MADLLLIRVTSTAASSKGGADIVFVAKGSEFLQQLAERAAKQ